jgi:hypothetical protein
MRIALYKVPKRFEGHFKMLEGQKNARGQWVGHPWFKASIINLGSSILTVRIYKMANFNEQL